MAMKILLAQSWIDPWGLQANRFAYSFTRDAEIRDALLEAKEIRMSQVNFFQ